MLNRIDTVSGDRRRHLVMRIIVFSARLVVVVRDSVRIFLWRCPALEGTYHSEKCKSESIDYVTPCIKVIINITMKRIHCRILKRVS